MIKKLTRTGNSVALVLEKPILEELGLDENSEVEVSTNGQVLIMTPKPDSARRRKLNRILEELDAEYGGVFKRLAE
jgi:antitoxin component of MazEF toxin-antitoxin module